MYITVEGPEASGKSSQAKLLADKLEANGGKCLLTKEPGSPHDQVCKEIRSLLLNPQNSIAPVAALFLFLADRAQHIEVIKKALADGFIVISDRSSLSTLVYHTALTRNYINDTDAPLCAMLDMAQQISPDICFVCTADFDWSADQLAQRKALDRIELFATDFHKNTHRLFNGENVEKAMSMMKYRPKRLIHVPPASEHPPEIVADFIWENLNRV